MEWTRQQSDALRRAGRWLDSTTGEPVFYLAGYAGTGKTTLARHLAEGVNGTVLFMAYTGKAASVMRSKGCEGADTIHHFLYSVSGEDGARLKEIRTRIQTLKSGSQTPAVRKEIAKLRRQSKDLAGPSFALNPDSDVQGAGLVVLDECSMVNAKVGRDLLSFGTKVLVLGDPAQLPPVRGAGFFTSREPDVTLTEIHRQARGNPILRAATAIREGRTVPYGDWDRFRHLRKSHMPKSEVMSEVDAGAQVLTGRNRVRRGINKRIRDHLGRTEVFPVEGDKLVCLRNDREMGVLNGVLCEAASDAVPDSEDEFHVIDLDYEDRLMTGVALDRVPFRTYEDPDAEVGWARERHLLQADYGYALTVHKSQGSQWPRVLVADDGMPMKKSEKRQWLYTAVTRASERLTLVT